MLSKVLLFLCLCCQTTKWIVAWDVDCVECTSIMDSGIASATFALERSEPIGLEYQGSPCDKCSIRGLSSGELTPDFKVCPVKTADGGHRFPVSITLPHFSLNCTCELPCNPATVVKDFADPLSAGCATGDNADILKASLLHKHPEVDAESLSKLDVCAPADDAGPECNDDTKLITDTILLKWVNGKITFNSYANSKDIVLKTAELAIEDFTLDSAECITKDPKFERSCKCLLASNFVQNKLIGMIAMAFECVYPLSGKGYELKQYLHCPIQFDKNFTA